MIDKKTQKESLVETGETDKTISEEISNIAEVDIPFVDVPSLREMAEGAEVVIRGKVSGLTRTGATVQIVSVEGAEVPAGIPPITPPSPTPEVPAATPPAPTERPGSAELREAFGKLRG